MSEAPSASVPWALDREPLTTRDVARLVGDAFPDLRDGSVRSLGHGWDFDAFLVDATWVFRFPRHAKALPWQARELRLLTWLDDTLSLPVPRPARVSGPTAAFPYPFHGHRLLEGLGGDKMLPAAHRWDTCAQQLGTFFRELHDATARAPASLALEHDTSTFAASLEGARGFAPELERVLAPKAWALALRYLEGEVPPPPDFDGAPTLRHADLFLEHVLFDPATGGVAGIIDWADAGLGDPAHDFVTLWVFFDEAFLQATLDAYAPTDRPGLTARVRYGGVIGLLRWIGETERYDWDGKRLGPWANDVFFPRLRASGS